MKQPDFFLEILCDDLATARLKGDWRQDGNVEMRLRTLRKFV